MIDYLENCWGRFGTAQDIVIGVQIEMINKLNHISLLQDTDRYNFLNNTYHVLPELGSLVFIKFTIYTNFILSAMKQTSGTVLM